MLFEQVKMLSINNPELRNDLERFEVASSRS